MRTTIIDDPNITEFQVPADFGSQNEVHGIGAGSRGIPSTKHGGGGGCWSMRANVGWARGSTVPVVVGAISGPGEDGGDTIAGDGDVIAKGGRGGGTSDVSGCVGDASYPGGDGAPRFGNFQAQASGGGGGAGGPGGSGQNGDHEFGGIGDAWSWNDGTKTVFPGSGAQGDWSSGANLGHDGTGLGAGGAHNGAIERMPTGGGLIIIDEPGT